MPHPKTQPFSHPLMTLIAFYLFFFTACMVIQLTGGSEWAVLASYIPPHQDVWRLLTAHFVHSSWSHFGLNLAGAALCLWVFRFDIKPIHWLCSAILISLFSSLCMLGFQTFKGHYMGFSDTLYGWILMGIVVLSIKERALGLVLFTLLIGRIGYEHLAANSPFDHLLGEGIQVSSTSHLFGLLGGALYSTIFYRKISQSNRQTA